MTDDPSTPPGGGATSEARTRAQPLSVEDRRAMIVAATIPLLIEHGREVTSKQIAEAAGIAEGTVFRAFGDKDTLIEAAIERHLDPEPLRDSLRRIDPSLPLENKIRAVIILMQERFRSIFRMLAVVGHERRPKPSPRAEFAAIIATLLAPEAEELNFPTERAALVLRLISFASSFPALNEGAEFSVDELTQITLTGLVGQSPARSASAETSATALHS